MGSLSATLGLVKGGLLAQQASVDTTSGNVANANTPGYVRRSATLEERRGGGVEVVDVARTVDRFSSARATEENGRFGAADAEAKALAAAETIAAPSSGTIGDAASALFGSFRDASVDPSDLPSRQVVIGRAEAFASAVSSTAKGLEETRVTLLADAQSTVSSVNADAAQIATYNSSIEEARSRGENPSDLMDKRSLLLDHLGETIGARGILDAKGQMTVFAAGTTLVGGTAAASLSASLDPAGKMVLQVTQKGGTPTDITSHLDSGRLAGITKARDSDIPSLQSKLDTFASEVGTALNAVHQKGFDLAGNAGGPFFAFTAGPGETGAAATLHVDAGLAGHPEKLAAASSANDVPGGNGVLLELVGVETKALPSGNPPAAEFAAFASSVGLLKAAADGQAGLRKDTLAQAREARDSVQTVSIDEEMVNLTRFQRAFEANTKVLQTVNELLGDLMTSIR